MIYLNLFTICGRCVFLIIISSSENTGAPSLIIDAEDASYILVELSFLESEGEMVLVDLGKKFVTVSVGMGYYPSVKLVVSGSKFAACEKNY